MNRNIFRVLSNSYLSAIALNFGIVQPITFNSVLVTGERIILKFKSLGFFSIHNSHFTNLYMYLLFFPLCINIYRYLEIFKKETLIWKQH